MTSLFSWTNKSRYGSLRVYKLNEDKTQLGVICHDVTTYTFSVGNDSFQATSIDPDGGPFFKIGGMIPHEYQTITIEGIRSHERVKSKLILVFDVKVE